MPIPGPLILGASGEIGRALARIWAATVPEAGPGLWQHRPGTRAPPARSGHRARTVEDFLNSVVARMRGRTALPTLTLRMPSAPGALEIHRNRWPRAADLG